MIKVLVMSYVKYHHNKNTQSNFSDKHEKSRTNEYNFFPNYYKSKYFPDIHQWNLSFYLPTKP